MNITTKYNTNDKVWFYVDYLNKYAWGKVISMDVRVRCGKVDLISYHIKNRYYNNEREDFSSFSYRDYDYRKKHYLSFSEIITLKEQELFENIDDLKKDLEQKHRVKMDNLSELKKNIFNL